MVITLRVITADNFYACASLTLGDGEERFVAPNVWGIAESQFFPWLIARAIYNDDTPVGFVLYGYKDGPDADPIVGQTWHITRFMIDASQRGKGFGRAGMRAVIEAIGTAPDPHNCPVITLSYRPGNIIAARLYASLGFETVGVGSREQTIMRRSLRERGGPASSCIVPQG